MDLSTVGKRAAAEAAVDSHVKDGMKLGIGSGSTIVFAVEHLAKKVKNENISVVCVPTSFQSQQLILQHGLILSDLQQTPQLDLAIDGADEIDQRLTLIKGGGGCLLQEKIVANAAENFVVIADDRKQSKHLGTNWKKGIPIEVVPMAYKVIQKYIEGNFGGKAVLREGVKKAGPVITDNGNFLLDWVFTDNHDWQLVNNTLLVYPGIVETGLFISMAKVAYIGKEDGTVVTLKPGLEH